MQKKGHSVTGVNRHAQFHLPPPPLPWVFYLLVDSYSGCSRLPTIWIDLAL